MCQREILVFVSLSQSLLFWYSVTTCHNDIFFGCDLYEYHEQLWKEQVQSKKSQDFLKLSKKRNILHVNLSVLVMSTTEVSSVLLEGSLKSENTTLLMSWRLSLAGLRDYKRMTESLRYKLSVWFERCGCYQVGKDQR